MILEKWYYLLLVICYLLWVTTGNWQLATKGGHGGTAPTNWQLATDNWQLLSVQRHQEEGRRRVRRHE